MPPSGPIRRNDLIRALRRAGFDGPESGHRHQFMRRRAFTLTIPNPHAGDIGRGLFARILREAGISRREWEKL